MDKTHTLIEKAKRNDRNAFGELYETYVDGIYRYVFYRLFDKADAEDVTEEVFIKAMKGIGGYSEEKGSFAGWLYGIARNAINDYCRTERRRTTAAQAVAGDGNDPIEERDFFTTDMIHKALAALTEDQREVIVLRFYAGLKIAEVAEHIGKPETAVKALQRRAAVKLAKALGGE